MRRPFLPELSSAQYYMVRRTIHMALPSTNFARYIIPGVIICLFLRCIGALFDPANRTNGGIRWPLVVHTVVMFSVVAIYTATTLDILSISKIDNRELLDTSPSGPPVCRYTTYYGPKLSVSIALFLLNTWLADGLLVSSGPVLSLACLTLAPLALSLLHYLHHEPLDHRFPLPNVPCLYGYVPEHLQAGDNLHNQRSDWRHVSMLGPAAGWSG